MNTPDEITVDAAAERQWALDYKASRGLSWSAMARVSGIPQGTLSPFMSGSYIGNQENVAVRVFRFRQQVESQDELAAVALRAPEFVELPTAARLRTLMSTAQSGEITLGCTAPGIGKSYTAKHFAAAVANAYLITCYPTMGGVSGMIAATLRALGSASAYGGGGWKNKFSHEVQTMIAHRNAVLIYDEAGFLCKESIEEIRSWSDITGVGVCFLGNEELWAQIRGGARNHAFARLNSRISNAHLAEAPEPGDVEGYLDAWGIHKDSMRNLLTAIAMTPGSGALREIRQIIKVAGVLAHEDGVAMGLSHLRDAQSTRTTRNIRVAA